MGHTAIPQGRVSGGWGGAGRSAEALRQNPYVNMFCYCVCVFLGEGGGNIYVCTGVLNGTNSLKIHPHTVHSRSFKKLQKKKNKEKKRKTSCKKSNK